MAVGRYWLRCCPSGCDNHIVLNSSLTPALNADLRDQDRPMKVSVLLELNKTQTKSVLSCEGTPSSQRIGRGSISIALPSTGARTSESHLTLQSETAVTHLTVSLDLSVSACTLVSTTGQAQPPNLTCHHRK